jgi:hypothetical protein
MSSQETGPSGCVQVSMTMTNRADDKAPARRNKVIWIALVGAAGHAAAASKQFQVAAGAP